MDRVAWTDFIQHLTGRVSSRHDAALLELAPEVTRIANAEDVPQIDAAQVFPERRGRHLGENCGPRADRK